jgi:protein SCO1/2
VARDGQGRPSRAPLVFLLTLTLAGAAVVGVLLARQDGDDSGPVRAPESRALPLRGNLLPVGIRGAVAPAFRLADARGGELDTRDLRGRPYAVTFLFTDCRDVCPLIGKELGQALELLGPQSSQVAVAAVSVDPRGDKAEAVRAWLDRLRLPPNFHYLIGSEGELEPVWKAYFVGPQPSGTRESLHSASIWLIDRRGRWRTKYSAGVPVSPRDVAHDLRLLLRERVASRS